MSTPMILFSLDPRKVHDERSRRLLGKHFYAITGNPRLDIKQTLTAAGNHSGLTLRPFCRSFSLFRALPNEETRNLQPIPRILIEKYSVTDATVVTIPNQYLIDMARIKILFKENSHIHARKEQFC